MQLLILHSVSDRSQCEINWSQCCGQCELHACTFKCKGMLVLALIIFRYTIYFDSQADVQLDKGNPSGYCGCSSSSTKDLQ